MNIKEIGIEELINKIDDGDNQDIFEEIKSRFSDKDSTIDDIFKVACKYAEEIADRDARIKELEAENKELKERYAHWKNNLRYEYEKIIKLKTEITDLQTRNDNLVVTNWQLADSLKIVLKEVVQLKKKQPPSKEWTDSERQEDYYQKSKYK